MTGLKRISMAGADVAVTDATVADLVLEYAMHLGRVGTTDIVTVPTPDIAAHGEVDLLLGPASQIVLSTSNEPGTVDASRLDTVTVDLRARIERVTGKSAEAISADDELDPLAAFVDFADYDSPK